ncbi:MAG: helicase, partial [Actinobacteria bacterium]|nr:helicase [Actinomycetota bacterium]
MAKKELTLKDRLSRLTFTQACKLLGPEGSKLIMQGGKFEINLIEENVFLDNKLFQLFIDGAVVKINLNGNVAGHLHFNCNKCQAPCEHVGAAFALILEEKTILGLAKPP